MDIQHDVAVFLAGGEVRSTVHRAVLRAEVLVDGAVDLVVEDRIFAAEEEQHRIDVLLFQLVVIVDEVVDHVAYLQVGYGQLGTLVLSVLAFVVILVFVIAHFLDGAVRLDDLHTEDTLVYVRPPSCIVRLLIAPNIEGRVFLQSSFIVDFHEVAPDMDGFVVGGDSEFQEVETRAFVNGQLLVESHDHSRLVLVPGRYSAIVELWQVFAPHLFFHFLDVLQIVVVVESHCRQ